MPWLEGKLARVLYSSDTSGYGVVRLDTEEGPITAVGTLSSLAGKDEGAFVSLEGTWESHVVHGRQFRATGLLESTPQTLHGLRIWLASSGVKGIGPALAGRLVDRFGLELPRMLRENQPDLLSVPGIGKARAEAIRDAWNKDEEGRALTLLLRGLGLSQRLADRIRDRYGERAAHVVQHEPFRLADEITGVGFRTADALARELGLPPDDPARVRAAVPYALEQHADQGHCFLPRAGLKAAVEALGVPTTGLDDAIDAAEGSGRVVVEGDRIWLGDLFRSEERVADDLRGLLGGATEEPADGEIEAAERWVRVTLDPSQRDAVRLALRSGVAIVTGGPGTGKTTLLRVLLRVLRERGEEVKLASPTGRAARRLEEATGLPASTLHRLLEYNPGEGGFQRAITNPLEADTVVVDEVSMVDLPLMHALTEALPVGRARLVLVGDADQLPSVGPGQVLRDLVASGAVPLARLTTIHRQAEGSGIVVAAADIDAGRVPVSGEQRGADDVFLLPRPEPEEAVETVLKVVADRLRARGFDPRNDVQVLAPTRRGPLGTERLNRELQGRLNAGSPGVKRGEVEFRVGDRVLCTKNRYDVEVFNGDVGRVLEASERGLLVDFDGRKVPWEREDLGLLDLAYAMTVHKSQGSEYPAVVLALHDAHGIMLRRNLFYTAATRAKRFLCVVGSPSAWARAVRQRGGDERNTALAERLSR